MRKLAAALTVILVAVTVAACGGSSHVGYTALAKSRYLAACANDGSNGPTCRCTLQYATAHHVSSAGLTAATVAFDNGPISGPHWLLSAVTRYGC